jgi:transcriptional regulator with XRE-family HTH domain
MPKTNRATQTGANPTTPTDLLVNWLERELPDEKDQREYAQERCIVAVTEALGAAMEQANLNRTQLAKKLGVSKSHISQVFAGRNLTLRTIGEVLWACGLEVNDLEVAPIGVSFLPAEQACEWGEQLVKSSPMTTESYVNVSMRSPGAYEALRADTTWLEQLNERNASLIQVADHGAHPETAAAPKPGAPNSNMALAA